MLVVIYTHHPYITSTDRGIITHRGHLSTDRGRAWMITEWLILHLQTVIITYRGINIPWIMIEWLILHLHTIVYYTGTHHHI